MFGGRYSDGIPERTSRSPTTEHRPHGQSIFRMKDPSYIAAHIRRVLKDGGSAPHSQEVQHFFKEEITSPGWYTAELRKVARRFRRALIAEHGIEYLVKVADEVFHGDVLEEKAFAV